MTNPPTGEAANKERFSFRIAEGISLGLALILVVAALYLRQPQAVYIGLVAGTILGFGNFRLVRRLVMRLTAVEDAPSKARMGLRFFIKLILLVGIVAGLLMYGQVNAGAFLLGFSTSVAGILAESLRAYL